MFANFYLFSGEMVYNDPMRRVIFIFIDGAGVGQADTGNPFFQAESLFLPFWQGAMILPDGTPLAAIDASWVFPGHRRAPAVKRRCFAVLEPGKSPTAIIMAILTAFTKNHPRKQLIARFEKEQGARPFSQRLSSFA